MKTFVGAILTPNKENMLTVVNGGGLGGPDSGVTLVAIHTDATAAGSWEIFKLILQAGSQNVGPGMNFALQTASGRNYVTAINGGDIGGPNDGTCPIHTDAANQGQWETVTLQVDDTVNPPTVRILTANGNYLTAVNGGGVGGPNTQPIHTDATVVGDWEKFTLTQAANSVAQAPAQPYRFSLDSFQILNTRSGNLFSSSSDTDYVSFSLTVNNGQPQVKTQSMGNLRNGVYPTNLDFDAVSIADTDNVVITYHIINSSKGEADATTYLQQAAEKLALAAAGALATAVTTVIGSAIGAALGIAIPVPILGSALGALAGWAVAEAWTDFFPNCDGPVAAAVHIYSGASFRVLTANGHKFTSTENNPGVNSPSGCGSNSNYNVTWSVLVG